ncbi:hypothetical protein R1flu_000535 [Riccia fluitans]|uniref:glycerol kinase n=1 Tax=Riccia fluitans TaxID=41844 RepID=A0ABD1Y166_9MARC
MLLQQPFLHLSSFWKSRGPSFRGDEGRSHSVSIAGRRRTNLRIVSQKLSREWVLAIDVGTGGTKAALISSKGNVSASAFARHAAPAPSFMGGPASMEQDLDSWWDATKKAIRSCLGSTEAVARGISVAQISAVAVTGQMQDVILLPKFGFQKISNAILYSDARAEVEAAEIAELGGGNEYIASVTGFPQGSSSVLAKLRWLDKRDPRLGQQCESLLLGGHDYVVWKLCGVCVTDATTASTTGLTNLSFQYAEDLLERVGLSHWIETLPRIVAPDCPCGEISSYAAVELGYAALQGISVLHCCGDAGTCTLGAGAGARGTTYAYLGTSGWVAGSFLKKSYEERESTVKQLSGVYTLAHPDPSLVFKTGSIMTAGGNLAWASSNLVSPSENMKEVDALVKSIPAGSGGLLYLPYLNGERCPFEDPNARAGFIGISAVTSRGHLLRAVMEGVAFAMRSARDFMYADQISAEEVSRHLYLVGGGARSPVWPAIMADVFGQTVDVLEGAQEVGVKGAALLAGQWLGWKCRNENWIQVNKSFEPSKENMALYEEMFVAYKQAYVGLRDVYRSWTPEEGGVKYEELSTAKNLLPSSQKLQNDAATTTTMKKVRLCQDVTVKQPSPGDRWNKLQLKCMSFDFSLWRQGRTVEHQGLVFTTVSYSRQCESTE